MIGGSILDRLRGKGRLLGVDLGSSHLKMVRLAETKTGLHVEELVYAKAPAAPEGESVVNMETLTGFLKELIKARQLQKSPVSSVVSDPSLTVTYLTLPWMPEPELREGVRFELKKQVAMQTDDIVFDYLVTDGELRERSMLKMVVFAVERRAVDDHVKMLQAADLVPMAVDTVPTALAACWRSLGAFKARKNYALIDLGGSNTTVSVAKGPKLVFARGLPFGLSNLTQAVGRAFTLEVAAAEDLVRRVGLAPEAAARQEGDPPPEGVAEALRSEIDEACAEFHRTLDYFRMQFREDEIEAVYLSGGLSLLPGLSTSVGEFLGLDCTVMNPLQTATLAGTAEEINAFKKLSPVFAVALGQATRGIKECGIESTSSLGSYSKRLRSRLTSFLRRSSEPSR
ncbi:MAG: type IV pilus assembly protein PilM [Nitrospirae bacterium]|nr:type IV pilus assembly protein PilM [Nitrospirota bacterium]